MATDPKDNAGNISTAVNDTIVLDTIAPVSATDLSSSYYSASNWPVTITVNLSDENSGVGIAGIAINRSSDGAGWCSGSWTLELTCYTDTVNPGNSISYDFSASNMTTGETYTVDTYARDNATNIQLPHAQKTFIYDTAAPISNSISINSAATYTNSTTATLTLASTDPTSGVYQMRFSNDNSTWSDWQAYATSKTGWALTSSDGTKTVYAQFKDNAGNISDAVNDTIIYDATAPVSTSISINTGDTYTTSTTSILTLSATDALSGNYQMRFSNDNSTWSDWETYATSKTGWTLTSSDGTKTVYAQFKDNAGNVSDAVNDTIIYDHTGPTTNAGTDKTTKVEISQNATVTDSISGVASYAWSKISGPGTITFGSATSEDTTISASADGTYVIRLTTVDNVDNTTYDEMTLIWDTVNPTVDAGSDQSKNATFTQVGTASDDSGIASYAWSQVSGPVGGTLTFGSGLLASTTISANANGTYVVRLTTTDNAGNSATDDFTLIWLEAPSTNPSSYHYEWVSQNAYPTLRQGQGYNFTITIKNTGSVNWYQNSVTLGTSLPLDRESSFVRADLNNLYGHPSNWSSSNRIAMQEDSVAPGENATFSFWMSASLNMPLGTYREYFRPVVDGVTWMEDYGIYWDVKVISNAEAYYPCEWVSQNVYPTLSPGQSYNFQVAIKNTGTVTWTKGLVNLGTNRDADRISDFIREDRNNNNTSGWISANRITMQEDSVAPGETANFSFWYTIPLNLATGTYREYFRPVTEGITWMEDYGIYWDITVVNPHAAWVAQSSSPTLHAGQSATLWVDFLNTGQTTWNKSGYSVIRLGASHAKDRISIFNSGWPYSNRINLDDDNIAPGQTGRFTFNITVPIDTSPGVYREYFQPLLEIATWLEDYGVYWDVTVEE